MILSDLPLDVLDSLCHFVPRRDLPALSRTASVFHPPAQRYLYRRLVLNSYSAAVRCLASVRTHKDLARCVRVLTMRLDPNATLTRAFVDLFGDVLAQTTNLTRLELVLPKSTARALRVPVTRRAIYPRLKRFSCNFPLDTDGDATVAAFLSCLPVATELQLGERGSENGSASAHNVVSYNDNSNSSNAHTISSMGSPSCNPLPPTAVPNLALFMGPSDAAATLVPGRPLESVHLYSGELTDDVLIALGQSSAAVTVLGAFTRTLAPSVLHSLAQHLPHLHHLRIMTMYHQHALGQPDELFYAQAVQILSTLPALISAELAGFRWMPWKDTTSSNSSHLNGASNTNDDYELDPSQGTQPTITDSDVSALSSTVQ